MRLREHLDLELEWILAEEAKVKEMAESGFMLTDTDFCCEVVCREYEIKERRKNYEAQKNH